jgi:hypothetical protein
MKWFVWRQYKDGRENGCWADVSPLVYDIKAEAEKKADECRYLNPDKTYEVRGYVL